MVGQIASFSVYTKVRGVMEHPRGVYGTHIEIKIKHPSKALFVIVIKTPTKELLELPIFNMHHAFFIACIKNLKNNTMRVKGLNTICIKLHGYKT